MYKGLILLLLLTGCGAEKVNYTIFLKEHASKIENLRGAECEETGYQLHNNGTELIIFYGNCDIHTYKILDEFDPKKAGLPLQPKKDSNGNNIK